MFRELALVAVFLVALVPAVHAQGPLARPIEFAAKPATNVGDDGFVDPESEMAEVPLVARVGCSGNEATLRTLVARFEVTEKPSWASAIVMPLSKEFKIEPAQCTDASFRTEVKSSLLVTITRDAPGLHVFEVGVKLIVEERPQTGGSASLPPVATTANLTVDYLPLVTVQPTTYFEKAPQGTLVKFPVRVHNIGNGRTHVLFDILPLGKNRLDSVVAPSGFELESRAQAGPTASYQREVVVEARTPSGDLYTNSIYTFQVYVASKSVDPRGIQTDESTLTLSIQVQGGPGSTPAPPLGWVLLGLLVLLVRRPR